MAHSFVSRRDAETVCEEAFAPNSLRLLLTSTSESRGAEKRYGASRAKPLRLCEKQIMGTVAGNCLNLDQKASNPNSG